MAYDEGLVETLRELLMGEPYVEKRMFGGLAFLIGGHIAVAASGKGGILVRVPDDEYDAARSEPGVEDFVMRERAMRGWLWVHPTDDADLARWTRGGLAVAHSLPPKS